ncbi:MAG: site-specific integrase, partial [Planctomycetales bacterium]|nr:site-specific integrase [Planctomycetales bacterium]
PTKPTPDFPLFPHASGQWAKKIGGKTRYFGTWADPDAALARYQGQKVTRTKIPSKAKSDKPVKPHPNYPMYAHAAGQWAKRVRNKVHYFGPWANPDAALAKWLQQKDDLLAGRELSNGEGLTIRHLANHFLTSKKRLVDSGELTPRTLDDYRRACARVLDVLGAARIVTSLRPVDFEKLRAKLAETHGPVALVNDITRIRGLFKYAFDATLIDRPIRYGQGFKKPSRATLRRHRQQKGRRMFQANELRSIIEKAGVQLRAMVYLGINCGLGNNDCAMLPMKALDLENGWMDFGRPKTGIHRRCPLWPETAAALRAALDKRPVPKAPAHITRVFITKYGATWEAKSLVDSPVSKEATKVLKTLKIHRRGLGFYALRHTFQTIGEKSRDKDAVRAIMGHAEASNDMSAVYNEEPVDDTRLRAVTDYIRAWLFPAAPARNGNGELIPDTRIPRYRERQHDLMHDIALRQGLDESLCPGFGNPGFTNIEEPQGAEPLEVIDRGVGDKRLPQLETGELFQSAKVL